MKSKKLIVFISLVLCIVAVSTVMASYMKPDKKAEETETSSVQTKNDSIEEKKVLNPYAAEHQVVQKLTAEDSLNELISAAKSNVSKSTTLEFERKGTPDFFSLDRVLRHFYSSTMCNSEEYVSTEESVSLDITPNKQNEANINAAEYMTFLSLLMKTHPDCVGFLDYKYLDYNYNRIFFPYLVFCPDFSEYGYDTIYDYIDAVRAGKETRIENTYIIDFGFTDIKQWGSDVNLYDKLFDNTITE